MNMTESTSHGKVLLEILAVLQRIEEKLDGHDERFRDLGKRTAGSLERRGVIDDFAGQFDTEVSTLRSKDNVQLDGDAVRPSRKGSPANDVGLEDNLNALVKIPYSLWSLNRLDRFFNLATSPALEERLGDCWNMPDDNRLSLRFFKSNSLKSNAPYGVPVDGFPNTKPPVERDLEFCCQFDSTLRKEMGNDFMVVDFDSLDNTRLYRLGERAIGSELEVEPQGSLDAPWSRLMYVFV